MKAILFRCTAVLISLVAVALLSEVALRLFAPRLGVAITEEDRFCRFDHDLGWAPLENVTRVEKSHRYLVHQNQFGLRGPDNMQLKKTPGRKRVLVLGDSYVWGVGASQEDLFTASDVHGTNDELINCGVGGYGTDQEYLFYLRQGEKFDVDQVILAFTLYNDVENNLNSKQYGYLKPYFTLNDDQLVLHNEHVRNSVIDNFLRDMKRGCRVWNLTYEGFDGLIKTLLRKKHKQLEADIVVSDADRKGIELTLDILKKLKDAVEARHAELCVVFIPYKPRIEQHLPGNHPFAPLIAAGLTQMGVSYREPYPEFLKSAMAGVDPFNPSPDNHFSAAGHALFAKFVTDTDLARASTDYYVHQ
ncbi:MAG TPA: SGNH/GDSL hydrolase family protein [Chthoniobacterales bacterium]|nr:SGNH/GDSL hydrolase family protein [Chthoniobacterales bacterium]